MGKHPKSLRQHIEVWWLFKIPFTRFMELCAGVAAFTKDQNVQLVKDLYNDDGVYKLAYFVNMIIKRNEMKPLFQIENREFLIHTSNCLLLRGNRNWLEFGYSKISIAFNLQKRS